MQAMYADLNLDSDRHNCIIWCIYVYLEVFPEQWHEQLT